MTPNGYILERVLEPAQALEGWFLTVNLVAYIWLRTKPSSLIHLFDRIEADLWFHRSLTHQAQLSRYCTNSFAPRSYLLHKRSYHDSQSAKFSPKPVYMFLLLGFHDENLWQAAVRLYPRTSNLRASMMTLSKCVLQYWWATYLCTVPILLAYRLLTIWQHERSIVSATCCYEIAYAGTRLHNKKKLSPHS